MDVTDDAGVGDTGYGMGAACADFVERFNSCPMCREPIADIFKVFA